MPGRSNTTLKTRPVIISRAARRTPVAEDLLITQVPFSVVNDDFGHFIGEFLAVADAPFGEEVVLDPDDLVDCAKESDFALEGETGVRHEGLNEDILDVAEACADVDVFDVEFV